MSILQEYNKEARTTENNREQQRTKNNREQQRTTENNREQQRREQNFGFFKLLKSLVDFMRKNVCFKDSVRGFYH